MINQIASPLFDINGRMDRILPVLPWDSPLTVGLREGVLYWAGKNLNKQKLNRENAFEKFLKLRDADDERIRLYAQRFGVLGTCEHGYPGHVNREYGLHESCKPLGWDGYGGQEALSTWRFFVAQANALCKTAARLHEGKLGDEASLVLIEHSFPEEISPRFKTYGRSLLDLMGGKFSLNAQKDLVSLRVDSWLSMAGARLNFFWFQDGTKLLLGSRKGSLFAVLALQLLHAVCNSEGIYVCVQCNEPVIPQRRPRLLERHYCAQCRDKRKVPSRDASRDYRARKKMAVDLFRKGSSVEDIARKVRTKRGKPVQKNKVKKWIQEQSGIKVN